MYIIGGFIQNILDRYKPLTNNPVFFSDQFDMPNTICQIGSLFSTNGFFWFTLQLPKANPIFFVCSGSVRLEGFGCKSW